MARLSEQEQQEIIRFLEADKPLPDKYSFLLFDDKCEVELVWNGCAREPVTAATISPRMSSEDASPAVSAI